MQDNRVGDRGTARVANGRFDSGGTLVLNIALAQSLVHADPVGGRDDDVLIAPARSFVSANRDVPDTRHQLARS